jgi:hypothetical protein
MIKTIIAENEKPQSDYLVSLLTKHFPEVNWNTRHEVFCL